MYYNARYYDPALGLFLSPDTIVPDAGRIIDYHRYGYVRNSPLKYTDPTGHVPWMIVGAATGGIVGGGIELTRQVINKENVNWRRVGVATVGGAVAGGTMGLASTTSLAGIAFWGAGSAMLGGQAAAITEGAFEYIESKSARQATIHALENGLLDPQTMIWDGSAGVLSGVASAGFSRLLHSQFSALRGAPNEITLGDRTPLYEMRWQQNLGEKGTWLFRDEGRKLIVEANGIERILRSAAQGGAEAAEETFGQLIEEGVAWWQNDD
jgi:hypothetical protein